MNTVELNKIYHKFFYATKQMAEASISLNVPATVKKFDAILDEFAEMLTKKEIEEKIELAREIVQIAGSDNRLYALCKDGSLWEINHDGEWTVHPPVPGDNLGALE